MPLKDILATSPLTAEEQADMLDVITAVPPELHDAFAQLFAAKPDLVPLLYKNINAKRLALLHNDTAALQRILEDERTLLEQLDTAPA